MVADSDSTKNPSEGVLTSLPGLLVCVRQATKECR